MMTDESQGRGDHSPTPDSISETAGNEAPAETVASATDRLDVSSEMGFINDLSKPSTSAMVDYSTSNEQQQSSAETLDRTVPLRLSLNSDIQLPGSSSSAFRPFVSEPIIVSPENTKSPTQSQQTLITTPTSRRQTIPGSTVTFPGSQTSESPDPDNSGAVGESSNINDDNDDGRTTASAPPCTPAPEPHIQVQSPFRNSRPLKRIDLLAMSRSRQSDRAENARRDGRLAPSPRKKDEVLRNSGYLCPANRSYGFQPNMRSMNSEGFISPDGILNGASTSSAASPNVDVVSVDDQNDASKYKFSIQFHNMEQAEQMMKCNLCGFVTNNQRFYRRHRRVHNRQHHPNQIQCNQCDYSTTQVRRMREHTMTHQNLPSQSASTNPHFRSSTLAESNQNPHFQGHFFIPGSTIYPQTTRPITLPLSAVPSSVMSNTLSLGSLHSFVPTAAPQEPQPQVQVNNQLGLQHPPRGSALLGNCSPNTGQVANYMRSFLSNLMSPTRSHPPSSVTSSSLYRSVPQESQSLIQSNNNPPVIEDAYSMNRFWNHSSNNPMLSGRNMPGNTFVKIKTEPRAAPISQMARVVHDLPSSTQQDRHNLSPRRPSDNVDSESGMDISSDERPASPLPAFVDSRLNARTSTETNHTDTAGGGDVADVSSQCTMPFIKIEFPSNAEPCNWLHGPSVSQSDCGVQCDIISMSSSHRHSGRTQSETVSSAGGILDSKCYFCGVTFDDEVLYSIHVGCHSHTDPFLCNVCGKQCHNKYGFYSHIMRGHQSRPNT